MKLLLDMNLSPQWSEVLRRHGWETAHWSAVGDPGATDRAIMQWAQARGYVVVTHDLDFGAILAATRARGPSVIQVRARDILPRALEALLIAALRQFAPLLEGGALIVVEPGRLRARVLPLRLSRDDSEE